MTSVPCPSYRPDTTKLKGEKSHQRGLRNVHIRLTRKINASQEIQQARITTKELKQTLQHTQIYIINIHIALPLLPHKALHS